MKDIALVTGAGRGLGLEITGQLLERGYTVLVCPRVSGSPELAKLGLTANDRLLEVPMDVADATSVCRAADAAAKFVDHVDLLINNAAVYPPDEGGLERIDPNSLIRAFDVNAVGPLRVVQSFLPLLRRGRGRRLIQVTSLMGSIDDNGSGGSYAYRMSKCALNMLTKNLAYALGPEGFVSLTIHPGWVRTRMGGDGAPLDIRPAVAAVLETALGAGPERNGNFVGADGRVLPY